MKRGKRYCTETAHDARDEIAWWCKLVLPLLARVFDTRKHGDLNLNVPIGSRSRGSPVLVSKKYDNQEMLLEVFGYKPPWSLLKKNVVKSFKGQ